MKSQRFTHLSTAQGDKEKQTSRTVAYGERGFDADDNAVMCQEYLSKAGFARLGEVW